MKKVLGLIGAVGALALAGCSNDPAWKMLPHDHVADFVAMSIATLVVIGALACRQFRAMRP
jgi:hypothetical protein